MMRRMRPSHAARSKENGAMSSMYFCGGFLGKIAGLVFRVDLGSDVGFDLL